MLLREQTEVYASPAEIFRFFENMEQNYRYWHPDHITFKWTRGNELKAGSEFYFEEYINGKLMKKRVRFTRIEQDRLIEFEPTWWLMRLFMPRLSFRTEPQENFTLFTAEIVIRTGPLGAWLNRREFDAVKKHMAEEGENMKEIVEGTSTKA